MTGTWPQDGDDAVILTGDIGVTPVTVSRVLRRDVVLTSGLRFRPDEDGRLAHTTVSGVPEYLVAPDAPEALAATRARDLRHRSDRVHGSAQVLRSREHWHGGLDEVDVLGALEDVISSAIEYRDALTEGMTEGETHE